MTYQKYVAEGLGAFFLTLAVFVSLVSSLPLATPIVAGLTLGLFVYAIGDLSGAHLNPAVTIGLWSQKVLSGAEAAKYVIAQLIGAGLASQVGLRLFGLSPKLVVGSSLTIGFAEALGAFVLVFVVSAVVGGKITKGASGLAIGGALLLGILLASSLSNGVLNPAVAIGIGSVSLMYLIGPLVGGALGAWVYSWLTR